MGFAVEISRRFSFEGPSRFLAEVLTLAVFMAEGFAVSSFFERFALTILIMEILFPAEGLDRKSVV